MKGWKTVIFNIAMLALTTPEVIALIPLRYAVYVTVIGNLILRALTTTPIGRSESVQ